MAEITPAIWDKFKVENNFIRTKTTRSGLYGMAKSVFSSVNREGFSATVADLSGNIHAKSIVTYYQRTAESAIIDIGVSGDPDGCVAPALTPRFEQEIEVGADGVAHQFIIKQSDLQSNIMFNGRPETVTEAMARLFAINGNALIAKIDLKMAGLFNSSIGAYHDAAFVAATPKQLKAFAVFADKETTQDVQVGVTHEAQFQDFNEDIFVVGGDLFNQYILSLRNGTGNDGGVIVGQNLNDSLRVSTSKNLDTVPTAADSIFCWPKGFFQIVEGYRYLNPDYNFNTGETILDTMSLEIETVDGDTALVTFDVQIKIDTCDGEPKWIVTMRKFFNAWSLPLDIYNGADTLINTNGLFSFQLV